jgi:hypothetical protein
MELKLNPKYFVKTGHESDSGEYCKADRILFASIKNAWPELESWGDLPIGVAWGSYSQDVYLQSWLESSQKTLDRIHLLDFVAYIHWHEINGEPEWGLEPEKLLEFAKEQHITA